MFDKYINKQTFLAFAIGTLWVFMLFGTFKVLNTAYGIEKETIAIERTANTIIDIDNVSMDIVRSDLETYNKFSFRMIDGISNSIKAYSKKWGVPVGLVHSIMRIESEYKFWIEHDPINITVHGKKIKTKAVGLGGIVWEFWADSLKKHNIANTRTDLFLYDTNIEASTAILKWIINDELNKPYNNEINLINKIIKRYYGAYNQDYYNKMIKVTSNLWLKRIARTLIYTQSIRDTASIDSLQIIK